MLQLFAKSQRCGAAGAERGHSPNTYSTVALRCSLSSGALARRRLPLAGSVPDAIATYCLPLTSKVIGGAEKAEPILIFHNSSSEVSSQAATVPSIRPTKTRPPPVDSGGTPTCCAVADPAERPITRLAGHALARMIWLAMVAAAAAEAHIVALATQARTATFPTYQRGTLRTLEERGSEMRRTLPRKFTLASANDRYFLLLFATFPRNHKG